MRYPRAMSVVVFGANGFIGSSLTEALRAQGFDVNPVTSGINSVDFLKRLDPKSKTTLVWAASKVNPINANTDRELVLKESASWTQFLNTFIDFGLAQHSRIILLSSGGCTYDGVGSPFKESAPSSGVNEYGRLKILMERELEIRDIPNVIFRISNAFGPNQLLGRGQGVIAEWTHKIKQGERIPIIGALDSYRDYIYISDLVDAIVKAVALPNFTGMYNLGSGVGTSLRELLKMLSTITGKNLDYAHSAARVSDRAGYFLNIDKIRIDLSWAPIVNIEEGLKYCLS